MTDSLLPILKSWAASHDTSVSSRRITDLVPQKTTIHNTKYGHVVLVHNEILVFEDAKRGKLDRSRGLPKWFQGEQADRFRQARTLPSIVMHQQARCQSGNIHAVAIGIPENIDELTESLDMLWEAGPTFGLIHGAPPVWAKRT